MLSFGSVDGGDESGASLGSSTTFVTDDAVIERRRESGCAATSAVSTARCRVSDRSEP